KTEVIDDLEVARVLSNGPLGPAGAQLAGPRMGLHNAGRQDAHLAMRRQKVEVMDIIAETVLVTKLAGLRTDAQVKGMTALTRIADRLHANFGYRLGHGFGV